MKKFLTISLALFLVIALSLPAWAGRGHRHRHYHGSHHHKHHSHHRVHLHAVGAGLLGIGLITGAAIAAHAYHSPRVVVHHPAPPPRPRPAPQRWQGKPYRYPKDRGYYELGAAQVTVPLLNVRQNPGRHHAIISQVSQGTYLSVRAATDGWLFVNLGGGREGWVMKRHTTWGRPYADG